MPKSEKEKIEEYRLLARELEVGPPPTPGRQDPKDEPPSYRGGLEVSPLPTPERQDFKDEPPGATIESVEPMIPERPPSTGGASGGWGPTAEEKILGAKGAPPPGGPAPEAGQPPGSDAGGRVSYSRKSGPGMGGLGVKGIEAELEKANAQIQSGMKEQADVQQRLASTKDFINTMSDLKLEKQEEKSAADRAAAQNTANAKEAEIKGIVDDIAKTKPTRKNPYSDQGPGKGIALVLMSALAGAAAGFRGKESQVGQIIDANIERDYNQQKDALENKRTNLGIQKGIYGELSKKVNDVDDRFAAFKLSTLQDTQRRLVRAVDAATNDESKGKLLEAMGLVEQKKQLLFADLRQKNFSNEIAKRGMQIEEEKLSIAKNAGPKPNKTIEAEQEAIKQRSIPGWKYKKEGSPGPTSQDYEQSKPIVDAAESWNSQVGRLVELRKKIGAGLLPSSSNEVRSEMEQISRELILLRKVSENMGAALTVNEEQLLGMSDPNKIGMYLPQLLTASKAFNAKAAQQVGSRGYTRESSFMSPRQE